MNIHTIWQGNRKFKAISSGNHEVVMDAKAEFGGNNEGSSPMELVLMGLTGCMGIDVTMILEKMKMAPAMLEIEARGVREDETPRSLANIILTFHMEGPLNPAKVWRAIRLSEQKYCSVAHSLKAAIDIRLMLNGEEAAPE
ncbi:OsmC family protein [Paenibacillus sp. J2TS4]|uniref:OsmC family protein n=1 Tax=Paenibacillus sp. J2TS4 TaxID=2807194 RepID=UPI001AFEDFB3|nr:OsmC family protein [Paenibacillus sp. J2TS4]GIP33219.1 peroxiredoxin [Paenibacillus sp. J2TS4]